MITIDSILKIAEATRGLPKEVRHKAFELYANGYMNRPYEEDDSKYYRLKKELEHRNKALEYILDYVKNHKGDKNG